MISEFHQNTRRGDQRHCGTVSCHRCSVCCQFIIDGSTSSISDSSSPIESWHNLRKLRTKNVNSTRPVLHPSTWLRINEDDLITTCSAVLSWCWLFRSKLWDRKSVCSPCFRFKSSLQRLMSLVRFLESNFTSESGWLTKCLVVLTNKAAAGSILLGRGGPFWLLNNDAKTESRVDYKDNTVNWPTRVSSFEVFSPRDASLFTFISLF